MLKHVKLYLLAISLISLTVGCKKDTPKSNTDLLTQGSWKIVKTESALGTGSYIPDVIEDCQKDDRLTFYTNKTYKYVVFGKCDASDPDETDFTGDWEFSSDEKSILLNGESGIIEKLDDNTLIIVSNDDFSGVTIKTRVTLSH